MHWFLVGVVLLIAGLCIRKYCKKYSRKRGLRIIAFLLSAAFFVAGFVYNYMYMNAHDEQSTPLSYREVIQRMGFKSGHAYPTQIGSRTSTTSVTTNGSFAIGTGSFNVKTTSNFPVSYAVKGKSYIFEVPTNRTTFKKIPEGESSTMSIVLNNPPADKGHYTRDVYCEGYFIPRCEAGPVKLTWKPWQHGLAYMVTGHIASATISLPESDYNRVFGLK